MLVFGMDGKVGVRPLPVSGFGGIFGFRRGGKFGDECFYMLYFVHFARFLQRWQAA